MTGRVRARGSTIHAPITVLWGAFWLKSMKTRAPRSSFQHAAVTRSGRRLELPLKRHGARRTNATR
jgi:hypothetical protein